MGRLRGVVFRGEGNVSIEKPDESGALVPATWDTKCLDARGQAVNVSNVDSHSGNQVVIVGGTGAVDSATGAGTIQWTGSFTVAMYGGMTYWSASNPRLTIDPDGSGTLVAELSGYSASQSGAAAWSALPATTATLAKISTVSGLTDTGFIARTSYLGTDLGTGVQAAKTAQNAAYWGSFPADMVAFQELTGQAAYWYTSGGGHDAAKVALDISVNYEPAEATTTVPPVDDSTAAPVNIVKSPPASTSGTKKSSAGTTKSSKKKAAARSAAKAASSSSQTVSAPPVTKPPTQRAAAPVTTALADSVRTDSLAPLVPALAVATVFPADLYQPALTASATTAAAVSAAEPADAGRAAWLVIAAALCAAALVVAPLPTRSRR